MKRTELWGVDVCIAIMRPVTPTEGQEKRMMRLKYFKSYEMCGAFGYVFIARYASPNAARLGVPVLRKKIERILAR